MAGGETITLADGEAWTEKFREENPGAIKAFLYSKTNLNLILNQTGCAGIRMYNALDTDNNNEACTVLVGVDASGNDMTTGVILDRGTPCPSACDTSSPLYGS